MNFPQAIESGFRNYVNFKDRASRPAYWYWFLFAFIGSGITATLDAGVLHADPHSAQPLNSIFILLTFVPGFAAAARRLHDTNRSGWWLFLALIPLIGAIVLLVWMCQKSDEGANEYGAPPLA